MHVGCKACYQQFSAWCRLVFWHRIQRQKHVTPASDTELAPAASAACLLLFLRSSGVTFVCGLPSFAFGVTFLALENVRRPANEPKSIVQIQARWAALGGRGPRGGRRGKVGPVDVCIVRCAGELWLQGSGAAKVPPACSRVKWARMQHDAATFVRA